MIETGEILQTMAMIQEQNFDIRTITLGINLLDCAHPSAEACANASMTKSAASQRILSAQAKPSSVSLVSRLSTSAFPSRQLA